MLFTPFSLNVCDWPLFFSVGWLSGKEALYMESLNEDQIAEDLVEVLKKFLQKDHIPAPSKIIR